MLLELEMKVEVRAGDRFFFKGECTTHKSEAVLGGRGLADILTHSNVFTLSQGKEPREEA